MKRQRALIIYYEIEDLDQQVPFSQQVVLAAHGAAKETGANIGMTYGCPAREVKIDKPECGFPTPDEFKFKDALEAPWDDE